MGRWRKAPEDDPVPVATRGWCRRAAFVTEDFRALFRDGVPIGTPLTVWGEGP